MTGITITNPTAAVAFNQDFVDAQQAAAAAALLHADDTSLATQEATEAAAELTSTNAVTTALNTNFTALFAQMSSLISAVQSNIAVSSDLYEDASAQPPVYYLRVVSLNSATGVYTPTWFDNTNTVISAPSGTLTPVGDNSAIQAYNDLYTVVFPTGVSSDASGVANGDLLRHAYGVDTTLSPPGRLYDFWYDLTTKTVLTTEPLVSNRQLLTDNYEEETLSALTNILNAINTLNSSQANTTQTPSVVVLTADGSTPTGATSVTVANTSAVTTDPTTGTVTTPIISVAGVPMSSGTSFTWSAAGKNTLSALAVTVPTGAAATIVAVV